MMTLYLLAFAVGFQATPWIINSEIYPIHLAGTATGIAAATHWIFSFLVSSMFLTVVESDTGKVLCFLVFALFALGLTIFVYYMLPETAGNKISENVRNIIGEDIQITDDFEAAKVNKEGNDRLDYLRPASLKDVTIQ